MMLAIKHSSSLACFMATIIRAACTNGKAYQCMHGQWSLIRSGVFNRWTGFSTGAWDWNMGLEFGRGIFVSRPYNTWSTLFGLNLEVGASHN